MSTAPRQTRTVTPTDLGIGTAGQEAAVEVRDLVKRYPKAPVDSLAGVSFEVGRGEVFGFLGPTGPGKSTTIGILTTRIRPTRGRAVVAGRRRGGRPGRRPAGARRGAPAEQPRPLALGPPEPAVPRQLPRDPPGPPATELADALLEQFGLADRPEGRPDDFSGGQIQRMMIARALMHAPSVLFLDEPSTGLDPAARLFLWEKVAELKAAGTTVVITTHDMDEAAELSDRVAIIDHGTLLALDTPADLVRGMRGERTLDCTVEPGPTGTPASLGVALGGLAGVRMVDQLEEPAGSGWRFRIDVEGEAAAFVAPVAQLVARRRRPADRRAPGRAQPRGRLHPPDREGPAMSHRTPPSTGRRRHRPAPDCPAGARGAPAWPSCAATCSSPGGSSPSSWPRSSCSPCSCSSSSARSSPSSATPGRATRRSSSRAWWPWPPSSPGCRARRSPW